MQAIVLLIILIFLNAVFASAEIAVLSMSETKLKKLVGEGDRRQISRHDSGGDHAGRIFTECVRGGYFR